MNISWSTVEEKSQVIKFVQNVIRNLNLEKKMDLNHRIGFKF